MHGAVSHTAIAFVGAVLYGLVCAVSGTSEVIARIGYGACFFIAAAFFFGVYLLWHRYRFSVWRVVGWFIGVYFMGVFVLLGYYLWMCGLPHEQAVEHAAMSASRLLYYMPFLP